MTDEDVEGTEEEEEPTEEEQEEEVGEDTLDPDLDVAASG